ncbi:hypothetical protein GWP87_02155 [Morganella morganii]|nr:hypothetical protein [Morganella morganii]
MIFIRKILSAIKNVAVY